MTTLEELLRTRVARFVDRQPDWDAFADARVEGYRRAQHRYIGAGASGKTDARAIPAEQFTLSVMFGPPGEGQPSDRDGREAEIARGRWPTRAWCPSTCGAIAPAGTRKRGTTSREASGHGPGKSRPGASGTYPNPSLASCRRISPARPRSSS